MRFVAVTILCVISYLSYGQVNEGDTSATVNARDTVKQALQGRTAASFPGGRNELLRYLAHNLDVRVAPGDRDYKATVKFLVNSDGKITEVEIVETADGCARCEREAVRVIKRMPKWKPATQNGEPVASRSTQTITFRNTANRY